MRMDDLFGHVPQKGELAMGPAGAVEPFERSPGMPDPPDPDEPRVHTPDTIRMKFLRRLGELKASTDGVPWTPRMLHSHRAMAKYWAEWLKHGEGDRLLAEFRAELVRLGVEPMNPADGSLTYVYEC